MGKFVKNLLAHSITFYYDSIAHLDLTLTIVGQSDNACGNLVLAGVVGTVCYKHGWNFVPTNVVVIQGASKNE